MGPAGRLRSCHRTPPRMGRRPLGLLQCGWPVSRSQMAPSRSATDASGSRAGQVPSARDSSAGAGARRGLREDRLEVVLDGVLRQEHPAGEVAGVDSRRRDGPAVRSRGGSDRRRWRTGSSARWASVSSMRHGDVPARAPPGPRSVPHAASPTGRPRGAAAWSAGWRRPRPQPPAVAPRRCTRWPGSAADPPPAGRSRPGTPPFPGSEPPRRDPRTAGGQRDRSGGDRAVGARRRCPPGTAATPWSPHRRCR